MFMLCCLLVSLIAGKIPFPSLGPRPITLYFACLVDVGRCFRVLLTSAVDNKDRPTTVHRAPSDGGPLVHEPLLVILIQWDLPLSMRISRDLVRWISG